MLAELDRALRLVAKCAERVDGDWWIIGSTAALLAGCGGFQPDDIDIFGSTPVMSAFLEALDVQPESSFQHYQFRSNPYQRVALPGATPIEVMGGLEVLQNGQWQKLSIMSRIPVVGFGGSLWIPSIKEQIAIFELFGRPKDIAKAKTLRQFSN